MLYDPTRVFLGWDGPLLARAAEWLIERHGNDMSRLVIAVPGGRAGRCLREALARRRSDWRPPRILTQGLLTDELVELDRPVAGRLARTLAWEHALRRAQPGDLRRILAAPPGPADASEWARLAETVRSLHGELAPEGLDFEAVSRGTALPAEADGERQRWRALARVQASYRELLAELSLADPHEARFAAIEEGAVSSDREICLVGIADMNHLLRRVLEHDPGRTTALVFAPQELAEGFDAWGCLVTSWWKDRDAPIALEDWHVGDKPTDQARLATDLLSDDGAPAAEDITIGVANEEVTPYLERRLEGFGIRARHAAGVPLARTRPFRALQAVAAYVRTRRFPDYAALVRHPDVDRALREEHGVPDPAATSDAYFGEHLPEAATGFWPGGPKYGKPMKVVSEALLGLLRKLFERDARPLAEWCRPIRGFLQRLYGGLELDPEDEDDRVLIASLSVLAEGLDEVEALPAALAGEALAAADVIDLALRQVRTQTVPPAPAVAGEPTIELLGWLELALDDASRLIVTGFEDGKVPQSVHGDAFLPDGLRRALRLACTDDRLARDLYVTSVLCHSRETSFISGRRSVLGDPLVPSRLIFHCAGDRTAERVAKFLEVVEAVRPARPGGGDAGEAFTMPFVAEHELPERMRVTSFGTYLSSPYLYFLRYVLKLDTADDDAREMEPRVFGIFAHEVLAEFGRSKVKHAVEPARIEEFLLEELERQAERQFGREPLPAVALQLEQLAYRFKLFAERQAEWASQGWRIEEVEWAPQDGVEFVVDGQPVRITGRIDRIDKHVSSGRFAILDYKTAEKSRTPESVHGPRDGVWSDLQLPLYCHLTASFEMGELPVLGYVNLGRDAENVQFRLAEKWDEDTIEEGWEAARRVVRAIRAREFLEQGKIPDERVVQALCGVGLLGEEESEDGE